MTQTTAGSREISKHSKAISDVKRHPFACLRLSTSITNHLWPEAMACKYLN